MDTYAARICWNTKGWEQPSGDARLLESNSYAADHGFGHEEWLFNPDWLIDGMRYAYLQPVAVSRNRLEGEKIQLELWARNPSGERVVVALIRGCEVLSSLRAEQAWLGFVERGWLDEMTRHLELVGGDADLVRHATATELFNIAFDPADVSRFADGHQPRLRAGHPAMRQQRYLLLRDDDPVTIDSAGTGRTSPLAATPVLRTTSSTTIHVARDHNELQNALLAILGEIGGTIHAHKVIDFKVVSESGSWLFEVKTHQQPMMAIREGLGQLLHYDWMRQREREPIRGLVIGSPRALTPEADRFLQHLRDVRGLPIHYVEIPKDVRGFVEQHLY